MRCLHLFQASIAVFACFSFFQYRLAFSNLEIAASKDVKEKDNSTDQLLIVEEELKGARSTIKLLTGERDDLKLQNDNSTDQLLIVEEELKEARSTIKLLTGERDDLKLLGETKCNEDFPQHKDNEVTSEADEQGQTTGDSSNALLDDDRAPFKDKKYCFIHVGKSAGSKISCELGYHYAPTCTKSHFPQDNVLVRNKADPVHMGFFHGTSCPNEADIFLVATRNPLDRFISWFHYELEQGILSFTKGQFRHLFFPNGITEETCLKKLHTTEEWGKGCFSNFNEFATACVPGAEEGSCSKLAWDVAQGTIRCEVHNFFNYNFYQKKMDEITEKKRIINPISSNFSVAVLRQEYLAEDFYSLHVMYGDEKVDSFENFTNSYSFLSNKVNNIPRNITLVSEEGRFNLCRALSKEMKVYKKMILSAENLNLTQKEDSMRIMYESCPREILEEDV